ncbi:MAG TPA: hypothetical protein VES89_05835 [Candidatus Competibacteraceae bacterium]|nr:hypothetical protein [Candidatus Competibacteraceae bacterium]
MPVATYDAGYAETYGTDADCPERELWRAILRQAGDDLFSSNERIRQDAISFFQGADLLQVMAYAAIDPDLAPGLRRRDLKLAKVSPKLCRPNTRRITFRGQTNSLKGWAEVTGLSIFTLGQRLRHGWSIPQALTAPGRQRAAPAA